MQGTGQGHTYTARSLGSRSTSFSQCLNRRTNLLIPRPNGSPYVARDIRYADELQSLGSALEGL